ncbi:hypothetical protein CK203_004530 [Vitis vinifera]|uniref:Reactive oxygen species modulator 1 n=1 Tax=Vitis vinifera TaxID=29760 RepID=A0A438KFL7_VITVI|nr:hypothetical protein CK203_004530 [Vitis vinifera]
MARDSCLARVTAGVAVGGAVGGAVVFNAVFGLRETLGMGEKMLNVTSSNFPPPNELLEKLLTDDEILGSGMIHVVSTMRLSIGAACVVLSLGAVYGTYEAIRYKVPGLLKIRYIGQTTLGSAAVFGLFLGAGSLIHCGKSY